MSAQETAVVTMVRLGDIVSNRYRNSERYRYVLQPEKIEALIQSYEQSGFWDGSIQARPHPKEPGKFEIAFGHHRVEAARQAGLPEIGLVVSPRTNSEMLRMMADENREEFKHDALVGREAVAAVIEAYGRGEIELSPVEGHGANQQQHSLPGGKLYSLATVARFLGWVKPSDGQASRACRSAFDAYRETASTDAALNTIPPESRSQNAVEGVVNAAKAARVSATKANLPPAKVRKAEELAAKQAAKKVRESGGMEARNEAVSIGKRAARQVAEPKGKKTPDIAIYAEKLIDKCERDVGRYDDILKECRRLIPFVGDLDKKLSSSLADALVGLLKRDARMVMDVANALRSGNGKALVALLGDE